MNDDVRPIGWTPDLERILQFVRDYAAQNPALTGSDVYLEFDEGPGYMLFSALPRDEEFTGQWWREIIAQASVQQQLVWRIDHNPAPVLL